MKPIPCQAVETDWLAGAAGFEPLHLEISGVVRWRASDLIMRLHEEFGLSVSGDTIYRVLEGPGLLGM